MHSVKRQRAEASVGLPAPHLSGLPENVEWQALLAKDLPASVLSEIVASLLTDPASSKLTQAAVARCRKENGCTLKEQIQQLVEANVEEPDENFGRKMGSLANSMNDFEGLLNKAQAWIKMKGYEAAFELLWACVSKASDWEQRGSDSGGWDEWDIRADTLMLSVLDNMTNSWSTAELKAQIAEMEGYQKAGSDYGYESVFQNTIVNLKSLA